MHPLLKRILTNSLVADRAFKSARAPAYRLFVFNDEEGDAWSESGGAVHERA